MADDKYPLIHSPKKCFHQKKILPLKYLEAPHNQICVALGKLGLHMTSQRSEPAKV